MDVTLDLSRWRAAPRGVGYRRWSIVWTGLQLLLRLRFFKVLLGVAWSAGLAIAALGFTFSQSIASGGWLENLATKFGPRAEALYAALGGVVTMYPDVCVGTIFTLIFWLHSFLGLWLTLIALTAMIPRLITRDRASNALTIYLSRPLTTTDYLLGKLGTIVGVIVLVWTGPLLVGWLLSMLFATDRDFIVYSLAPLSRALLFNAIALVALAAISLGISAMARTSRATVGLWAGLWIVFGMMAAAPRTPEWIKRSSFTRDLSEIRQEVLRLDAALTEAGSKLPLLDQRFAENLTRAGTRAEAHDFNGALAALGIFVVGSSFVFFRKLRPDA